MPAVLGALVIGVALGMLGAGGSMLTVPILVYVVGEPEKAAIASSLAIVGLISASGALLKAWRQEVRWDFVMLFGAPGMFGSYVGAALSAQLHGSTQLLLFAGVAALASAYLFFARTLAAEAAQTRPLILIATGTAVGVMGGLVGVGGGFLIVPALVAMGGLEIGAAVATSLVVIALNSFVGLWKYSRLLGPQGFQLDSAVIGWFAGIGGLGMYAGQIVAKSFSPVLLRRTFATMLAGVALMVVCGSHAIT